MSSSEKVADAPIEAAAAQPSAVATRPRLDPAAVMRRGPRARGRVAFWLSVTWASVVVLVALTADLLPLAPYDVLSDVGPRVAPRFSVDEPLGTDAIGRSMASRLAFGARQSLLVGVLSTAIAMTIGMLIGMTAGYFRGTFDRIVAVLLDTILSIPGLVLLLSVAAVGKRDITTVIIGLSLFGIPTFARLTRANTLSVAPRDYVAAARTLGARHPRILFGEVFPNVVLPVSSYAFLFMAVAIVAEGSLSYLGLGIPPPRPSWGGMIADSRPLLESHAFLMYVPACCLVLTVISLTVIGDKTRRVFDVRESALR